MRPTFEENRRVIINALEKEGLVATLGAWRPLERIDFRRLVEIHGHEEAFLLRVFIESLLIVHRLRIETPGEQRRVNSRDVTIAMLMVGAAASNANESLITASHKALIKSICPYC